MLGLEGLLSTVIFLMVRVGLVSKCKVSLTFTPSMTLTSVCLRVVESHACFPLVTTAT